eukprot:c11583_g1_i1.p1 GENE.c11583_g1_i1~~c11583_g1_i1.p1  ORF type:complete len:307 (-),score=80.61 c11583_g1_i1:99-1019(-)
MKTFGLCFFLFCVQVVVLTPIQNPIILGPNAPKVNEQPTTTSQTENHISSNIDSSSIVLPEQISSIFTPPISGHDDVSASDVSNMFLTSRSDLKNTLMEHVKSIATQARSTAEADQLMGFSSPLGFDSSTDSYNNLMQKVSTMESQIPTELISPSGQKLSLTSFSQLMAQAQGESNSVPGAVANIPQGLAKISQEFGSTISAMAAHVGRLFGPSPSYNGPCQCRACMNVVHRLRISLFENTYHYGVQEIDQELDDRFCYGTRWMYRSTCYYVIGRYREMIKILVWLGTKEFDTCAFVFQCYPTSHV